MSEQPGGRGSSTVLFRLVCAVLLAALIGLAVLVNQTATAASFDHGGLPGADDLRTGTATVAHCARVDRGLLVTRLTAFECQAKVRWDNGAERGLERPAVVWSRHDLAGRQLPVREARGSVCASCPETTVVPADHPKAQRSLWQDRKLWGLAGIFLLLVLAVFPLVGLLNGPRKPRADGRPRRLARHVAAVFVVYLGVVLFVGGSLLIGAVDFRVGARPGAEVRATGTATVEHCRRAEAGFLFTDFTSYACPAEVTWQSGGLPAGRTTVSSLRDLSGQLVEVRSAKVSCGRRCVEWLTVPADHPNPSGAVRWWLGFGELLAGLLLIGLVTGAVLAIYRVRRPGHPTEGTALPAATSEQQGAGAGPAAASAEGRRDEPTDH